MALQTSAKVRFLTGKGNIDIELYAKELPVACRAFLQNCLDDRFVGLQFGRLLPDLVELTPNSQITHVKREFHSRIGFTGRGDVALLNVSGMQMASPDGFFITMKPLAELNGNYVIVGHVVGDLIYNVVKIQEAEKKEGTTAPLYPVTVTGVEILRPYFKDLVGYEQIIKEPKRAKSAVKLSYDDDDEDDGLPFSMTCAPDLVPKYQEEEEYKEEQVEMKDSVTRKQSGEGNEGSVETRETKGKSTTKSGKSESGELNQPALAPYDLYLDFWADNISLEDLRKHRYVCS